MTPDQLNHLNRSTVFRTGQVAHLCAVSPQTVARWIDSGRLVGRRIPGSRFRVVDRMELDRFAKAYGISIALYELALGDAMGFRSSSPAVPSVPSPRSDR